MHDLDDAMFDGVDTVLVTAGAAARRIVQALILELVNVHGCEVEQHDIFHESVEFGLPGSLKKFMRSRKVENDGRRIEMDDLATTNRFLEQHGIPYTVVDLTVNATD